MPEPRSSDEFTAARLAELPGHWLRLECGCGAVVHYPCPLLAKERGPELRVGDVLGRLCCRQCKGRPARVAMTNDPTGGAQGLWRVEIVP